MNFDFTFKKLSEENGLGFASVLFYDRKRILDTKKTIANLPKNSVFIYRDYDLTKTKRQENACDFLAICQDLGHKFFIGKDLELALKIGADGVHFSDLDEDIWDLLSDLKERGKFLISLSCHSLKSIEKAQNFAPDLLFLSPIFPTKSHTEQNVIGIEALKKACKISQKPIFALGGINAQNIEETLKVGAKGIGGIEIWAG